jgi:hypothetical protein
LVSYKNPDLKESGEKPAANPYKNAAEILDCCRLEKLAVCSSFLQVIHALFLSKKRTTKLWRVKLAMTTFIFHHEQGKGSKKDHRCICHASVCIFFHSDLGSWE